MILYFEKNGMLMTVFSKLCLLLSVHFSTIFIDKNRTRFNHRPERYVRPRVRLISLENAPQLLQASGGGGLQANYAHGNVLGSLGGTPVAGGNFGYGGENSGTDYAE